MCYQDRAIHLSVDRRWATRGMGQAQSADGPPPDTFLAERGLAPAPAPAGWHGGVPGLFGCDSATRTCCEKKVEQHDIRIAHNRPVIQQVRGCVRKAGRRPVASRAGD